MGFPAQNPETESINTRRERLMGLDRRPDVAVKPSLAGSLVYLLPNLPLGIFAATAITVLLTVGVSTAIIWVGVPLCALLILGVRGAADLERARVRGLLGAIIETPYQPLIGSTQKERWKVRLRDRATWRDITYFLLMLPIGIVQFGLLIGFWAPALGLVGLPIYYRYLPDGMWSFPSDDLPWVTVHSIPEALPWAALGVLLVAVAVLVTKGLGELHAKFAQALLGPNGSVRSVIKQLKTQQTNSMSAVAE